jgi:hypothetical protein
MKRLFLGSVFAAILALSATAQAGPVAVDFSVLMVAGVDHAVDITTPSSITLNGVTFTYDNFGTPINELGDPVFAQAQAFGIFGNPNNGVLEMSFATPVTGLSFLYSNLSNTVGPVEDALLALLGFPNGDLNGIVITPGNLNDSLTFDYQGPAFSVASLYFAVEAQYFTIENITYTPVPEPSTLLLLGSGLAGLAGLGWRRNRQ